MYAKVVPYSVDRKGQSIGLSAIRSWSCCAACVLFPKALAGYIPRANHLATDLAVAM